MKAREKTETASGKPSLGHVLKKTEAVEETVKGAAGELTLVNQVLKQKEVPVQSVKQAVIQNEDVEQKVAKAADELQQVNVQLTDEIAEREVIESELADTKTDLAEVRDDLTKAKAETEEAQQIALQDALTGLPNRVAFQQSLDQGLGQAVRHGWGLAVLFIDVDKFKSINDTHGHDAGDQVLLMVGTRLKSFIRDEDVVCRWAGDEFACLVLEVKQETDATQLAEKMVTRIAEPCECNGTTLSVKASIGIALYPADGVTADILFKNADTAMYKAKGSKKRVVLFREAGERKGSSTSASS